MKESFNKKNWRKQTPLNSSKYIFLSVSEYVWGIFDFLRVYTLTPNQEHFMTDLYQAWLLHIPTLPVVLFPGQIKIMFLFLLLDSCKIPTKSHKTFSA